MKINIVINISSQNLVKFRVSSYAPKCCQPIKFHNSLNCKILRKKWIYFLHADEHWSLLQVDTIILGECNQAYPKYQNKFAYLRNISIKAWEMELIFCLWMKVFYKMIVKLWVCIARDAQSTQNKFTISLQYVKENVRNEVDYLLADKRRRFLQSDTISSGTCGQVCPYYPK